MNVDNDFHNFDGDSTALSKITIGGGEAVALFFLLLSLFFLFFFCDQAA